EPAASRAVGEQDHPHGQRRNDEIAGQAHAVDGEFDLSSGRLAPPCWWVWLCRRVQLAPLSLRVSTRAPPLLGVKMLSWPSDHRTRYRTLTVPCTTSRTSPSRAGCPTCFDSMRIRSPTVASMGPHLPPPFVYHRAPRLASVPVLAPRRCVRPLTSDHNAGPGG